MKTEDAFAGVERQLKILNRVVRIVGTVWAISMVLGLLSPIIVKLIP